MAFGFCVCVCAGFFVCLWRCFCPVEQRGSRKLHAHYAGLVACVPVTSFTPCCVYLLFHHPPYFIFPDLLSLCVCCNVCLRTTMCFTRFSFRFPSFDRTVHGATWRVWHRCTAKCCWPRLARSCRRWRRHDSAPGRSEVPTVRPEVVA